MSSSGFLLRYCPQLRWPGKLFSDVGRCVTIMTVRDMWQWSITHQHHLLVDTQFRVRHQIWHQSWHGILCHCSRCSGCYPFTPLRPDTSSSLLPRINITALIASQNTYNSYTKYISNFCPGDEHTNSGLMWTKDKVAGYTCILVLAALQSQR